MTYATLWSRQSYKVGNVIPISQMRNMRHRETTELADWQSKKMNAGLSDGRLPICVIIRMHNLCLKGKKEEQGCLLFLGLFFQGWNIPHTVPEARSPKPRWQKANYSLVSSSFWWLQAFLGLWGHPSNLYLHLKWSSWPVPLYVLLFLIRTLNGFRIHPHAIWAHLHIYVNYICRDPLCKPGSGWTCILGRGTDSTHHSYRVSSRQDTPSLCLCIQPAPLWAFLSLTGSTQ